MDLLLLLSVLMVLVGVKYFLGWRLLSLGGPVGGRDARPTPES